MASPPIQPPFTVEDVLAKVGSDGKLGVGFNTLEKDVPFPEGRYLKEKGTAGGEWSDSDPFPLHSFFRAMAEAKQPAGMQGAGEVPIGESWRGRYAVKSKYDYVAVDDLSQQQSYHLGLSHERMHVARGLLERLKKDYLGVVMMAVGVVWFLWSILAVSNVSLFALALTLVGLALESWRGCRRFPPYRREEAIVEIGAAMLAAHGGATAGFTNYSATYVSNWLRYVPVKRREKEIRWAYEQAAKRFRRILSSLPPEHLKPTPLLDQHVPVQRGL